MEQTSTPLSDESTRLARDKLIDIHRRCLENRYAFFPAQAAQLLSEPQELRVVVFSSRGLGFAQQLDEIDAVLALKGGRVEAVIHDTDDHDNRNNPRLSSYRQITSDEFFANTAVFAGCIVVDRTSTWYPGIRYKVRLKQAGFNVLRVEQFLNAPGFESVQCSYRVHSNLMLDNFEQFLALERHWQDNFSRQTYYYALASFISMNYQYFALHCGDFRQRYFPADIDLKLGADTVYADCGSNDGSEIFIFAERAGHKFKAVHAFEPDRQNFIKLSDNIQRYAKQHGPAPIYCHEMGVFNRDGYLHASGYDGGVAITDHAATSEGGLHVCKLDNHLDELTHLRLEIEGAELAALHGARQLILKHRPTMTVSAYHLATDFPDLLHFIEETDMDYRLSLRHQSLEPGVLCIYAS